MVEGLKLLSGRSSAAERIRYISAYPRFVPEGVPERLRIHMANMTNKEFEKCVAMIRSKDGVSREEFDVFMKDLGLGETSAALFKALDDSEGKYERGSGMVMLYVWWKD